ncbi:META domain-containing protein [Microbacterium sp. A93]|uniref:META domain-containing protein n=1 Tax=Microbacterium sp. A93 TaxID=3450716 RepID=UPI003F440661
MEELTEHLWGSDVPGQPWLRFDAGGRLYGSDGCNRLMGQWTLTGDRIEFGRLVSTMMFCRDVDTWLFGAARARWVRGPAGGRLEVSNAAGEVIGALERSGAGPR